MEERIRDLWILALEGSDEAYLELGVIFWKGAARDKELARLCLDKSAEMGNEEAFCLYHCLFSKGKKVIDDNSYQDLCREFEITEDPAKRKVLEQYLRLGTAGQKHMD